jgi:hypothetical protein
MNSETELLTIGSEDGVSLLVRNNIKGRAVMEMTRHGDIHFCSRTCFMNYFFHDNPFTDRQGPL